MNWCLTHWYVNTHESLWKRAKYLTFFVSKGPYLNGNVILSSVILLNCKSSYTFSSAANAKLHCHTCKHSSSIIINSAVESYPSFRPNEFYNDCGLTTNHLATFYSMIRWRSHRSYLKKKNVQSTAHFSSNIASTKATE